jgi:hypothetical protein
VQKWHLCAERQQSCRFLFGKNSYNAGLKSLRFCRAYFFAIFYNFKDKAF